MGRLEYSSIDHIGHCAGPITVHAIAEEAHMSLSQSHSLWLPTALPYPLMGGYGYACWPAQLIVQIPVLAALS